MKMKMMECSHCGYMTMHNDILLRHIANLHPHLTYDWRSYNKKFTCEHCGTMLKQLPLMLNAAWLCVPCFSKICDRIEKRIEQEINRL